MNARELRVAIPRKYLDETLGLLSRVWHKNRKCFTAIEASKMVGKLARLSEGGPWVYFMISDLYRSIAQALAQNKYTLETSSFEFQELIETFRNKNSEPTDKEQKIIRFALSLKGGKNGPPCTHGV